MEAEEPMEHSPEHVTETGREDEAIDVDESLVPDRSPSTGPQGVYDYDDICPKSQESSNADERLIELNEHDANGDSESDSEESPESPPPQASFPMEQEFPIVDEQQPLNIRSPEIGRLISPDENLFGTSFPQTSVSCANDILGSNEEPPSIPQETAGSLNETLYGGSKETPGSPQEMPWSPEETPGSPMETPGSPQETPGSADESPGVPREIPGSPQEDTEGSPVTQQSEDNVEGGKSISDLEITNQVTDVKVTRDPASCSSFDKEEISLGREADLPHGDKGFTQSVVSLQEHQPADSTVLQEESILSQVPIAEDSFVHMSIHPPTDREPARPQDTDKDGYVSEGECDGSKDEEEEDIYSFDLMGGTSSKDRVCGSADLSASNREATIRDSHHSVDSLGDSDDLVHDTRHYTSQGDADSKISQSVEKPQTFSETDDSTPVVHSSVITSPSNTSAEPSHDVSGCSEVSQSSTDQDSNIHSTSIPSSEQSSKDDALNKTAKEGIDPDSVQKSVHSHGPTDIPNGVSASPESDVKAGKVQANTSFNEEHVELDYDEEEGDDMHGHAAEAKEAGEDEDKQKEGSGDEKQDGELSSSDEDKDDGELDDDEDCEEGEIREPGGRKPFIKPICRFYTKGNCTWGNNCRFLHPGVNDKGNYRLFESPSLNGGIVDLNRRFGQGWGPEPGAEPELPPPPPELPASESAWERGLRHAKEMRKKANQRKEQETNFEEKRMNLSLDEERDLNKENERSKLYVKDPYYDQFDDDEYYGKSQVHGWQTGSFENFEVRWTREPDYPPYRHEKERERFKERHYSPPIERMDRIDRLERQMFDQPPRTRDERRDKYRDDRMEPPPPSSQAPRGRADEWHDPWQRSKSPKQKRRSSRSHSRGRRRRRSYSVSSHSSSSYSSSRSRSSSFSSRSSRSSYSRSSSFSSRSPSPRPTGSKKNALPPAEKKQVPAPKPLTGKRMSSTDERKVPPQSRNNDQPRSAVTVKSKQRSPDKRPSGHPGLPGKAGRLGPLGDERGRRRDKLPHPRAKPRSGSRSSSGSSFSRSRSRSSSSSSYSRSGSASSISSRSKSRSRSRSSSTSSSGSADSEHLYRDLPGGGARTISPKKKLPNKRPDKGPSKHDPLRHRRRDVDRDRDRRDDRTRQDSRSGVRGKGQPHGRQPTTPVKPKDPLKLVGQKSNIKLTLLNKPADKPALIPGAPPVKRRPSDVASAPPPKRQALLSPTSAKPAGEKPKPASRPEKTKSPPPKEKPISPTKAASKPPLSSGSKAAVAGKTAPAPAIPSPIPPPPAPATKQKKSMSSRREELLKQLKAVEDAIARKKAKMQ